MNVPYHLDPHISLLDRPKGPQRQRPRVRNSTVHRYRHRHRHRHRPPNPADLLATTDKPSHLRRPVGQEKREKQTQPSHDIAAVVLVVAVSVAEAGHRD